MIAVEVKQIYISMRMLQSRYASVAFGSVSGFAMFCVKMLGIVFVCVYKDLSVFFVHVLRDVLIFLVRVLRDVFKDLADIL